MFRQKSVPVINDLWDKIFALNISAEWIFGISMQSYNSYQSKANIIFAVHWSSHINLCTYLVD